MSNAVTKIHDTATILKAAGLIAASAAVATILDLGLANVEGDIVVDVTALEIASNDEIYDIVVQFSDSATFGVAADIQDAGSITLSAKEVKRTDSDKDDIIGQYVMPFTNEITGTIYRYMRLFTVVAGTIATGINYSAFATKKSMI